MTYASQQDLIDRFGEQEIVQITDRTNSPPSTIDATKVARALSDADTIINSYIASRYDTPVSPVPDVLVEKACAIARYKLYSDGAPDRVNTDYGDALKWLVQVSSGVVVLSGASSPPAAQSISGTVKVSAPARTFTRDSMRDL